MSDVSDSINVILRQRGGTMIDHKLELFEDLDQLRDYAMTVKRAATDMLDWCHVIETDMQAFIEYYTGPAFMPPKPGAVQEFEPGSPCIDPDGEGCRCYEGCTADCPPSEYQACKCPRKVSPPLVPQSDPTEFDVEDDGLYTLTDKGKLIVKLVNEGYKYLEACRIAETVYEKG